VYGKLASDLVPAITLMENGPVKSAVTESPEPYRVGYHSLKSPACSLRVNDVASFIVNANHSIIYVAIQPIA
jgi:hypothetical protein